MMAGTSDSLDRAAKGRQRGHSRAADGKEALFSTAPSSTPPPPVDVYCPVCQVVTGITSPGDWWTLVRPPFLVNPLRHTVYNRCPNCGERTWLEVGLGPSLRALLGRPDH